MLVILSKEKEPTYLPPLLGILLLMPHRRRVAKIPDVGVTFPGSHR